MTREVKDNRYNKTLAKWLLLILVIGPSTLIFSYIAGVLTKDKMFSGYIEMLVSNWIFLGGSVIWIIGAFLIQGRFLFKKSKYKSSFICFLLFIVLIAIAGKSLANGWLYEDIICFAKDLPYVEKSIYEEKIEKLDSTYKTENIGKTNRTTIHLKTENNTYQLMDNIVTKDTYEEFKNKFKKVDKVKIKYLPNTKFILSVEPVNE